MSGATPGPWEARRRAVYAPTPGGPGTKFVVATAGDIPLGRDEDAHANAAHIASCVNAHDALVAAIAHAIFCLQPYKFGTGYPDLAGIYDDLNLAIARAQGQ